MVNAVTGKAPRGERYHGNEVVRVYDVVNVVILGILGALCGNTESGLAGIDIHVVTAEGDFVAKIVAVVKGAANHVGNDTAAAVAGYPDLDAAFDSAVTDVLLDEFEGVVTAAGEA